MFLPQLLVGPKCFMKFNTRTRIVGFRDYTNNIIAKRRVHQTKHPAIAASGARNLTSFAPIYVGLRRDFVGSARLDLDETKGRSVVRDHVDFSIDDHVSRVASDRS